MIAEAEIRKKVRGANMFGALKKANQKPFQEQLRFEGGDVRAADDSELSFLGSLCDGAVEQWHSSRMRR